MQLPDMNLLVALDALLDEGSVVGAARRMNLSPAAMSRTLTRIREAVGDPVLVRAGRGLVATPRALALHGQVRQLVEQANQIFNIADELDLPNLERVFNLRANDAFIAPFSSHLLQTLREQAPLATLRFLPHAEGTDDDDALRDGRLDLYIGDPRHLGPEVRIQGLFSSRMVCLARQGHPLFDDEINAERFASFDHITLSRHGLARGPIDAALADLGLQRRLSLITPSFHAAMLSVMESDLLLPLPEHMLIGLERFHLFLRAFQLPVSVEPVKVIQAWHPRLDNDPAHRWLREAIKACCTEHQL